MGEIAVDTANEIVNRLKETDEWNRQLPYERMKRQIKFRGRRLPNDWYYGSLDLTEKEPKICFQDTIKEDGKVRPFTRRVAVAPETIGQYTGLNDRNELEVYEGDIFTVEGKYPRVVVWDKVSWALMPVEHYHDKYFWEMNLQHPDNKWWEYFAEEIEVIGNIHNNPIEEWNHK